MYGTGLDLAYAYAPADMKGFVTACFLVTNAIGNFINSQYGKLYATSLTPAEFFAGDGLDKFLCGDPCAAIEFCDLGRSGLGQVKCFAFRGQLSDEADGLCSGRIDAAASQ